MSNVKKSIAVILVIIMTLSTVSSIAFANDYDDADVAAESTSIPFNVSTYEDIEQYSANMREHIRNLPDTLVPSESGRFFYVSNNGNDNSDGLTPATAWASLSKVNARGEGQPQAGDVVLLERGSIFRGELRVWSGISYGAYGTGEKPAIYGSPINAATAVWSQVNTNLWQLEHHFSSDVGVIVFDHGAAVGVKQRTMGDLRENFDFFYSANRVTVYYDGGNPALAYDSIELGARAHVVIMETYGSDMVIENLQVLYGGAHGIYGSEFTNAVIRGNEIGWIGGSIQSGNTRWGNGVECWEGNNGFIIEDSYFFQIYDAAVTYQGETISPVSNVTFRNNLMEYNTYGIEYFQRNSGGRATNILFEGNIMRFAGYGWGHQRPDKDQAAHIKSWTWPNPSSNFRILNNILDTSRFALFQVVAQPAQNLPTLANNVYAQEPNGWGGHYGTSGSAANRIDFTQNVGDVIRNRGMDPNPTIIFTNTGEVKIDVSAQTGTLTAGIAGTASFRTTIINADHSAPILFNNINRVPGISLEASEISWINSVITVEITSLAPVGVHPFTFSIDGNTSEVFEVRVRQDPLIGKLVTVSAQSDLLMEGTNNTALLDMRVQGVPADTPVLLNNINTVPGITLDPVTTSGGGAAAPIHMIQDFEGGGSISSMVTARQSNASGFSINSLLIENIGGNNVLRANLATTHNNSGWWQNFIQFRLDPIGAQYDSFRFWIDVSGMPNSTMSWDASITGLNVNINGIPGLSWAEVRGPYTLTFDDGRPDRVINNAGGMIYPPVGFSGYVTVPFSSFGQGNITNYNLNNVGGLVLEIGVATGSTGDYLLLDNVHVIGQPPNNGGGEIVDITTIIQDFESGMGNITTRQSGASGFNINSLSIENIGGNNVLKTNLSTTHNNSGWWQNFVQFRLDPIDTKYDSFRFWLDVSGMPNSTMSWDTNVVGFNINLAGVAGMPGSWAEVRGSYTLSFDDGRPDRVINDANGMVLPPVGFSGYVTIPFSSFGQSGNMIESLHNRTGLILEVGVALGVTGDFFLLDDIQLVGKDEATGTGITELLINITPETPAGIHPLTVTAGNRTSNIFFIEVNKADEPFKTITVSGQNGELVMGEDSLASFEVAINNINLDSEVILINYNSVPGITLEPVSLDEATITINIKTTSETPIGSHPVSLVINGVISDVFNITVTERVVIVGVSGARYISFEETAKNSRIWVLTFSVDVAYSNGSVEVIIYSINLNGNNRNMDGRYAFGTEHDLTGYTLHYDIKGNGSNIKEFVIR